MNGNGNPLRGFLGAGWSFPLQVDGRGGVALSHEERDIEEAIRIILSTPRGERRMRPNFGCGIHDLIFAPNNATTAGLVVHYVEEALGWWEPRVTVNGVQVHQDPEDPARFLVDISHRIKATNDQRNLVYPFYRIPGER